MQSTTTTSSSSSSSPSRSNTTTTHYTYEAARARQSTQFQPDQISWSSDWAYRQSPYRQLHHQKGCMGVLEVRLLEARDLERSYWSALALPGVKHLGLSKAHGAISSYAQVSLVMVGSSKNNNVSSFTSPVVTQNDHPVWNNCVFDMPLRKGTWRDGEAILLKVEMAEEASAADRMGPLLPSDDDRILGSGTLDVSPILLGTEEGAVGVMDVWVPITKQDNRKNNGSSSSSRSGGFKTDDEEDDKKKAAAMMMASSRQERYPQKQLSSDSSTTTQNNNNNSTTTTPKKFTGRVRLLVSYRPHGLEPQEHDLVALEAFARRNPTTASCRPILEPLAPMRVLKVQDAFLLVEYRLNHNHQQLATMRIPRNAVFVIERTNLVDGAVHFAMQPADLFFSTPVGHKTREVAGPLVGAAAEVAMPAVLSAKLVWTAARTTAMAGMTGVHAATNAVWQQSKEAHQDRHHKQSLQQKSSSSSSTVASL